jgi:streptomycin 6-kinase
MPLDIPSDFTTAYAHHNDDPEAHAWIAQLPTLADEFLSRWALVPTGRFAHGMASLALPVRRADGSSAVLKLQQLRAETKDAATGLRAWNGLGAVRLLDYDDDSATMLLEQLDAARPLSTVHDDTSATQILGELTARLNAVPAPSGLRRVADLAANALEAAPFAVENLHDPEQQRLIRACAAATTDLLADPSTQQPHQDRLLHWDLYDGNVLAGGREPWLAIDPEPVSGDPGYELFPILENRWDVLAATGSESAVHDTVLRRFDQLTETTGQDRHRAAAWTLARILQEAVWAAEDGKPELEPSQSAVAAALLNRRQP